MEVKVSILILLKIAFTRCEMEAFIVGGEFVKSIKDFPHVASLLMETEDEEFICGSTILNQVVLITAAHCLEDVISGIATVGNLNRMKGTPHDIRSYKIHENWNRGTITNDIALCKLRKPIQFGNTVRRAILMRNPPDTEKAEVAGWGAVEEIQFTGTDMLKHTEQRLWTYRKCKTILAHVLPVGTICGGEKQSKTKCASKGDSGSGLIVRKNIIIGIVSFKNFKVSNSLVVYTDTTYFYEWILKHSKRLTKRCAQ